MGTGRNLRSARITVVKDTIQVVVFDVHKGGLLMDQYW